MFKNIVFIKTMLVVAGLMFFFMPLQAELRDPTRPSGISYADVDSGMQSQSELSLQAIFFNPENASVLINGKRFVVGDWVGDSKIEAIFSDHVVLSGTSGKTHMSLAMPTVKSKPGARTTDAHKMPDRGMK